MTDTIRTNDARMAYLEARQAGETRRVEVVRDALAAYDRRIAGGEDPHDCWMDLEKSLYGAISGVYLDYSTELNAYVEMFSARAKEA